MKKIKKFMKLLKTRAFWIEYFGLYLSIVIVTVAVQAIILHTGKEILIFCLLKSLLSSIISVAIIMLGRRTQIIKKHFILEAILYMIASIPYMELTIIYIYKDDITLVLSMLQWYAIVYFIMGLGITELLRMFTKKIFK